MVLIQFVKTFIKKNQNGQILLELIVAVGIFALVASSMISLVLGGNAALLQGSDQINAQTLAQEGIEAVRAVRDRAWNEINYNQSAVATSSGQWAFSGEGTSEKIGIYTRTIIFSDVCRDVLNNITVCPGAYLDRHAKKVDVKITWLTSTGITDTVDRIVYVTNWDSRDWQQTDWSGGPGQSIWSDSTKFDSGDSTLDRSMLGEIKLAPVGGGSCGLKTWTFLLSGSYVFDSDIQVTGGVAQLKPIVSPPSYPTTKPTIHPVLSYSVTSIGAWQSFSETAVKGAGTEIYYQLSSDNGSSWQYWSGSAWSTAGTTNYNTATIVNANIGTFATSTKQITFKAFLVSSGTNQVQLSSISLGCTQNHDWPFDVGSDYTYDSSKISVSGGVAKLISGTGSGATTDSGFNYIPATSYSWPFDTPSDYAYDSGKISVSSSLASLVGANNNTFRVTEYYLAAGAFSGTNYNLTLNQNLSSNYFVILQGSDGDGTASNDRGANVDYASLMADPWGTGDLNVSTGNNVIGLYRRGATNSWVGVVTVVECLTDCAASGFNLLGVTRVNHAGTTASGTQTAPVAWTNLAKTMLIGGYNGSGCDTSGTAVGHHKACQNRIYPSGTNTINWARNATGGTLINASSTVMTVQWGTGWNMQRVTVTGSAGGTGANLTTYYNTATITSVARANTWVWGTGWAAAGGIGNGAEGVLITLGNGVAKNTNETTVAVGAYYAVSRSFDVYALTNPSLLVDYQFKTNGDSTSLTYDQTTSTVASQYNRMALVYNGCASTATSFPIPIFSARYYTDTSIRMERRRTGVNFPAWTEGINFSGILSPISYPTDWPNIYPINSYSSSGIQSWSSFTETANKNSGEIYYQLSGDDGTTWKYWTGSAWATALASSSSNIASVINTNISSFATSTQQIKFRSFLQSNGAKLVQLDNINLGFSSTPSVWSYSAWDVTGAEVMPAGTLMTSGGNPGNYAKITVPISTANKVGGYWQQAFTSTASNPKVTVNFDYSVIDFNSIPSLAQIRVYLDPSSGVPVNQIGSSISVSALKAWTSTSTVSYLTSITSPGTYYLKIAFWVESATNSGPYSVGFDNVSLNWDATGYPTTSPTIQPAANYSIPNLGQYTGFTETATKAGTGEIYYQLSDNGGASWKYWTGLIWGTAASTNYNTASIVNTNIASLATTSATLIFKAFLVSNGTDQVQLDNVKISWSEAGSGGGSGYQTFGSFVSSAYNLGKSSPVQILEWNEGMVSGGDIKLQIRTAPDSGGTPGAWTSWYGLGGANTYFIDPSQTLLSTSLNWNQWLQYRAEISGDGSATPVLYNVKINYK